MVKMPGATAATCCETGGDCTPLKETITLVEVRPAISYGTITLICVAEANVGVPAMPSNSTRTPPRVAPTPPWAFTLKLADVDGPRPDPLIAINSPGAISPK